jgi:hypothetical protein
MKTLLPELPLLIFAGVCLVMLVKSFVPVIVNLFKN